MSPLICQRPLRPRSSQSPLPSPLRPRSSQSPLSSPLRPRSLQSLLPSPLRPRSSQSPLQSPLRPRSSQSPLPRAPAGSIRLPRAPAGSVRLSFVSAGPVRLSFISAAPETQHVQNIPTFAPPECLPEVVDLPFLGGSYPPLLTETPDPPWPMESPNPSWLPEAPDLPWPPKLPASVLETICALSASCVSVSSRSQSLPWVSSAPPWWAPVSSAPPWWALVSSALHGPGPPSPLPIPPLLHRPPGLFYVWSVWMPLFGGGGGSVTNPVHELTPTHHIFSCTTLQLHITHGLHFPSTIALITQLSPITHLH